METFFRSRIEGLLLTASWVEKLRRQLGLEGVSQVWGDRPAWYFWLAGAPCTYCLSLEMAEQLPLVGGDAARGRFAIKSFPYANQPEFESFSRREQQLVQSESFDQSNTPTFEAREQIDPALFNVATLELSTDQEDAFSAFSLTSQEVLRRVSPERKAPPYHKDLPAWRLSYMLFQGLVGLYAFSSKRPPARALLISEPGFEQVAGDEGQSSLRPVDDAPLTTLTVLFCQNQAQPGPGAQAFLAREFSEQGSALIFDQSFTCAHFHPNGLKIGGLPVLSQDWWRLAQADYKSELATSCGCEH